MRAKLANLNHCAVPFLIAPTPTCAGTILLHIVLYVDLTKSDLIDGMTEE